MKNKVNDRYWLIFLWLAGGFFLLNWLAVRLVPLNGDEAYYSLWARHLSWGYYDHPPMIAWLIRLSTLILGNSALGVKFFSLLLGLATWLFFYKTVLQLTKNSGIAFFAGLLLICSPFLNLYFCLAYPDAPLLFFWVLSLYFFARALTEIQTRDWLFLGFAIAFTALSKLTGLIFLLGIFRYWIFSREKSGRFFLILPGLILGLIPVWLWNYLHHWQMVAFQLHDRHHLHNQLGLKYFWDFLLQQAAVFTFFLFLILLFSLAFSLYRHIKKGDQAQLFAASFYLPVFGIFALFSLLEKIQPYWTLPGFFGAFISLAVFYEHLKNRLARGFMIFGLLFALAVNLLAHSLTIFPSFLLNASAAFAKGEYNGNSITETYAYPQLGREIRLMRDRLFPNRPAFLVTESYQFSSVLTFYSGEFVHLISDRINGREYYNWENYPAVKGQDALFIDNLPLSKRPDVRARLEEFFERIEELPPVPVFWNGLPARMFYPVKCYNFKPNQDLYKFRP